MKPCRICGQYPTVDLDDDGWFVIGCDTIDCFNSTLGGLNRKIFSTEREAVLAWDIAQEENDGIHDTSSAG